MLLAPADIDEYFRGAPLLSKDATVEGVDWGGKYLVAILELEIYFVVDLD